MDAEHEAPEPYTSFRTPEEVAAAEQKAKPLEKNERAPRNDDDFVEPGERLLKALCTPLTLNRIRRWGEAPGGIGRLPAEETLYWLELKKRVAILRLPNNPQKMYYDPLQYTPPLAPLIVVAKQPTPMDIATKVEAEARHDDVMKLVEKHMKPAPRHMPPTLPAREPFPSKEEVRANQVARLAKARQEKLKPMAKETPAPVPKHLLTKVQAAQILGVKPSWLGPKANNKGLARQRVNGKLHYEENSVRALAVLRAKNGEMPAPGKSHKRKKAVDVAGVARPVEDGAESITFARKALQTSAAATHEKLTTVLKAHSLGIFDDAEALAKFKQILLA